MKIARSSLAILVITILAAAVRLAVVFKIGDFSWDEMFSFTYSQKPWLETLKFWLWETNPPLHMLLLKMWFYFFPQNELWARLPSVALGIASVPLFYNLVCRMYKERIGIIASALLAFSPYHIYISTIARGYSLLIFLAILSVYLFQLIFFTGKNSLKFLFLYSLISALALFTHLTSVVLLLGQFLIILATQKNKLRLWLVLSSFPLALCIIWTWFSFADKSNLQTAAGSWFFLIENSWLNVLITLRILLIGSHMSLAWIIIFVLIFSTIFHAIYRQLISGKVEPDYLICLILGGLPLVGAVLLHAWDAKFIAISIPWLYVLIAHSMHTYIKKTALQTIFMASLLLPGLVFFRVSLPLHDWQGLNTYINRHCQEGKKQILIYNHFIDKLLLNRYYNGCIPSIPYAAEAELRDWDKSIITKNYLRFPRPETELIDWLKENNTNSFDELFLLKTDSVGVELEPALKKRGWRLAELERAYAPAGKTLLRYVNARQKK